MKKVLVILALGTFAVACNSASENSESKTDTAAVAPATVDSPKVETAPVVDTTKAKVDTAVKK